MSIFCGPNACGGIPQERPLEVERIFMFKYSLRKIVDSAMLNDLSKEGFLPLVNQYITNKIYITNLDVEARKATILAKAQEIFEAKGVEIPLELITMVNSL